MSVSVRRCVDIRIIHVRLDIIFQLAVANPLSEIIPFKRRIY